MTFDAIRVNPCGKDHCRAESPGDGLPGGSAPAVKNATSLSLSIHWSIQKYQVLLVLYHLQVSQQKKLHAMQVSGICCNWLLKYGVQVSLLLLLDTSSSQPRVRPYNQVCIALLRCVCGLKASQAILSADGCTPTPQSTVKRLDCWHLPSSCS